jgi:formylglycine-generating enzyme required for sulfatase activity
MWRKMPLVVLACIFIANSSLLSPQTLSLVQSSYIGAVPESGGVKPGGAVEVQGIAFVPVPGGTFQMGSAAGLSYEQPVHSVTVSAFQMSRYEITQAQYLAVMAGNPSKFTGDDSRPVEQVSWYEAVTFCNKLSERVGLQPCYNLTTWACDFSRNGFRLPTEAEWEYACRAGTATKYYTGEGESDLARAGWYFGDREGATHAVGKKEPNAFGLYDMHGNVWEWCNDWYGKYEGASQVDPRGPATGTNRISRGGSWQDQANECRPTVRYDLDPGDKNYYLGFRVVRR